MHGAPEPSPWVCRWAAAAETSGPVDGPAGDPAAGRRALDLACGSGRHLRWLAARGWQVHGVDRDAAALETLRGQLNAGREAAGFEQAELEVADLESGPWPLAGRCYDLVIVTNYLWRPRWAELLATVAPGGWWVHETFAQGHETVGRPSNPDFLLRPGELLAVAASAGLRVIGYEDGYVEPPARFVQRIAAVRPGPPGPAPDRWHL
jgi:SAM-dependent methyltransferase